MPSGEWVSAMRKRIFMGGWGAIWGGAICVIIIIRDVNKLVVKNKCFWNIYSIGSLISKKIYINIIWIRIMNLKPITQFVQIQTNYIRKAVNLTGTIA